MPSSSTSLFSSSSSSPSSPFSGTRWTTRPYCEDVGITLGSTGLNLVAAMVHPSSSVTVPLGEPRSELTNSPVLFKSCVSNTNGPRSSPNINGSPCPFPARARLSAFTRVPVVRLRCRYSDCSALHLASLGLFLLPSHPLTGPGSASASTPLLSRPHPARVKAPLLAEDARALPMHQLAFPIPDCASALAYDLEAAPTWESAAVDSCSAASQVPGNS